MDIQNIINDVARQLHGTNALIQIQVGNEYYTRRVGDINLLVDNPCHVIVSGDRSFLDWMMEEITHSSISQGTKINHISTHRLLSEFNSELTFSDITYHTICDFDYFLHQRQYAINTIAKFMKIFKRYVNVAIDNDLMSTYPFRKYKIRMEDTHKNSLTEHEVKKLETNISTQELTEEERDVANGFLFSIYSGLRYSDIIRCTKQHIKNLNRNKWLVMRMQKTDREVRIPLSRMFYGHAVELVRSINTTTGKLFHLPNNARTNIVLSRVLRRFGIRKHISFHCARVSAATILLHRGINITTIQHILGHRSIKTTQVYAAVTDSTIYRDVRRAFK